MDQVTSSGQGPAPASGGVDEGRHASLLRLATWSSVGTASLLIVVKFGAWLMTGSVSVLASLVDSLLDMVASVVNLVAVRYSLEPADDEHRFGHGKAEYIAGLAQSTFIGGSAILLLFMSVDRLVHPQPVEKVGVGIGVMVFSILATLILIAVQRYVINRTHSVAIKADSLHYVTDFLTNLSIIAALLLAKFGWPGFDPLFALGIAIYIMYSAWRIGHDAVQLLLDRELPPEVQSDIRDIALSHEGVRGVHEMRTRRSGQTHFIQLHIEMDGALPLMEAHRIADEVMADILSAYPNSDVIIHQDPYNDQSGR